MKRVGVIWRRGMQGYQIQLGRCYHGSFVTGGIMPQKMPYRRLGRSGLKLSLFSYGSWVTFGAQMDVEEAAACMRTAYDAGVNFFDNAEAYANGASERIMGQALKREGWNRDSFVVSSKVFWGGDGPNQKGLSRKHVREACDAALTRLQLDYLDLFFCHRPDLETPIEETARAMDDLIRQGKVLYWGTSEWTAQQLQEAYGVARQYGLNPPTMEQPQYNMFVREKVEKEFLPLYDEVGLGTTIWSPLASGILTGKYRDGYPDGSRATLEGYEWLKEIYESEDGRHRIAKAAELEGIAAEVGCSLAQLSLVWCTMNPHVSTVILGASRRSQLRENLKALDYLDAVSPAVMERIEAILGNRPQLPTQF
jgi:voltage-dependent potassium channel beta subunit